MTRGADGRFRLVMVVNPVASSVSPGRLAEVRNALAARQELEVVETRERDHATELARRAAKEGADAVVVLGGDGTQNEAANGLVGSGTALAVLPGGSTNVFARTIGMGSDSLAAVDRLLDALERGAVRRVGLGAANGRYFLFHVGVGYDAAVVAEVERKPGRKRRIGQAAFVVAGVSTWTRRFDRRHPLLMIVAPGHPPRDAFMAICLNTNPYTYLGNRPLDLAPGTGFDTGLSVLSLHTLSLLPLLAILGSAIGIGKPIETHDGVERSYDHHQVVVRGHQPFPYQADGDYLGTTEELVVTYEPDRLDLVLP